MSRIAAGWLLLAALLPTLPPSALAAEDGVCNVRNKAANLEFTLKDIKGREVRLSSYKGQVILLDFWATWCVPCRSEIPKLTELYRKYRARGFVVLGVSIDDPLSRLEPYVAELRMSYPVLVGEGRDDVQEAFGPMYGVPTSVLISRDGTICRRHTGATDKQALEQEILALL